MRPNLPAFAGVAALGGFLALAFSGCDAGDPKHQILNVSYDATREVYRKLNRGFAEDYDAGPASR